MAAGVPYSLATLRQAAIASGNGKTLVMTTTTTHTAGHEIVCLLASQGTRTNVSVTDSAGNSYTVESAESTGATTGDVKIWLARSNGANALASGGTITWTTNGLSGGDGFLGAYGLSGMTDGQDAVGGATGTSASPASGSVTNVSANATWFGFWAGATTVTGDSEYTGFTELFDSASSNMLFHAGYKLVNAVAAVNYQPGSAVSCKWACALESIALSVPAYQLPGFLTIMNIGS